MLLTRIVAASLLGAAVAPAADAAPSEEVLVESKSTRAPKPSLKINLPDVNIDTTMFTFPSGLRVMFQHDASQPVAAITSVTDHGASSDPEAKEGIAHLVEHLWFRSEHGELPKTWDLLESEMGCSLNAFTQYDITAYMTVCPSSQLAPMLQLESLRVTDTIAKVTQEMVTTEIEVVRNEIRMRSENFNMPFFTLLESMHGHIYPAGHPYSRAMAGDHESIRNIVLEDIQTFTDAYYRPDTTTMMIVGDLSGWLSFTGESTVEMGSLLDLVGRTFDPKLLDPNMEDGDWARIPITGLANPDETIRDDWWEIPLDPATRGAEADKRAPLNYLTPLPQRVAEFAGLMPADPATKEMGEYEAPVETPTVIVAWTLPPAYQGQDTAYNIAANFLSNAMGQGLTEGRDSKGNTLWKYPGINEFAGCSTFGNKRVTTAFCVMEVTKKADPEYLSKKMLDQLARLHDNAADGDPMTQQFYRNMFTEARNDMLARTLRSADLFSAVGAGRATETAQFAHFTGDPRFFKITMQNTQTVTQEAVMAVARKWFTRERSTSLFVTPMDREDVSELSGDTVGAGGHARGGIDGAVLKPSIPIELLTPAFIRSQFQPPRLDNILDVTLGNGLRVVALPHSESAIVDATIIVKGGSATDMDGLDLLTELSMERDREDALQIAGQWSGGNGDKNGYLGLEGSAGNLDGILWMLRSAIDSQDLDLGGRKAWAKRRKKGMISSLGDQEWHVSSMRRTHLNPDHATLGTLKYEDYDSLAKLPASEVQAYHDSKWQPANATLVVVGNTDTELVKVLAETYFGGWKPTAAAVPFDRSEVPPPNEAASQVIYVLDDEGKTQTDVTLACPLANASSTPSADHQLLGDVASTSLFAKLREEAGVVYSPHASVRTNAAGGATMIMSAQIQNDSATFGLQTYLQFLEQAAAGKIDPGDLALKKLSRARRYVTQQQSVGQMASRINSVIANDQTWGSYKEYGDRLANVSPESLAAITKGCSAKAFVSMVGPVDVISAQLDEAGITYEVLDWEQRGRDLHAEYDPKGFAKAEKKRLKDEAKKAEEEAEEAEEADSDSDEDAPDDAAGDAAE